MHSCPVTTTTPIVTVCHGSPWPLPSDATLPRHAPCRVGMIQVRGGRLCPHRGRLRRRRRPQQRRTLPGHPLLHGEGTRGHLDADTGGQPFQTALMPPQCFLHANGTPHLLLQSLLGLFLTETPQERLVPRLDCLPVHPCAHRGCTGCVDPRPALPCARIRAPSPATHPRSSRAPFHRSSPLGACAARASALWGAPLPPWTPAPPPCWPLQDGRRGG